jgi:hypothetical protein
MAVKVITTEDYNRYKRHDYAGTVKTLLPSTVEAYRQGNPDWNGKHWAMWNEGGTVLGPVNVED